MLSDDFISDVLHRLPLSEILESCAYSCALKQNVCAKGAANTEGTGLGHDDTLFYPKVLLLEQLGSSLNVEEQHANKFCVQVFQACREFEKPEGPLFCNDNITELCLTKNGLIMVCVILEMNENGTVMTFKLFEEKYDINTNTLRILD